MKREFLQNLRVGDAPLPKELVDAIMAENGSDIQTHKQAAKDWEEKYNQAVQTHQAELQRLEFEGMLKETVTAAKGRNLKAITALLDVDALRQSQDLQSAMTAAVAQLKQENAYLFDGAVTPTPYAVGTGTQPGQQEAVPQTLAGALRERFQK